MDKNTGNPGKRSRRVMDQCLESGWRLRFEFHLTNPGPPDDGFTHWLHDRNSLTIDWSNFGNGLET